MTPVRLPFITRPEVTGNALILATTRLVLAVVVGRAVALCRGPLVPTSTEPPTHNPVLERTDL